jgi:hypothetical protein
MTAIIAEGLSGARAIIYLAELDGAARAEALRNAGALLTHWRRDRPIDVQHRDAVHSINRRGQTGERVDWIGTPDRLNELLER